MSGTANPTVVPFQPSNDQPFTFQATVSTGTYTVIITWSLAGQRYYFNLYTLGGVLVASMAMVGSPPNGSNLDLSYGQIAPDSIIWRPSTGNFEVYSG
jgi:hypothetical protein